MADSKITELTELTAAASEDLLPIVDDPAGTPITKKITLASLSATAADMEAGTSTGTFVTPAQAHRHPASAKCWAYATVSGGTPTLAASYNITSITDTGTGQLTITIATDFSGTSWAPVVSTGSSGTASTSNGVMSAYASIAAGSVEIQSRKGTSDALSGSSVPTILADPISYAFVGFGDHT